MAKRKKSCFSKVFGTIVVVLLVVIVAIAASFFFYAPPVEHSTKVYDVLKFKNTDYTAAFKTVYSTALLLDINHVSSAHAYYKAKDGEKGEGDVVEFALDTKDNQRDWGVVVMCDSEAGAKLVAQKIEAKYSDSKSVKVVRRNKAVIYGTLEGSIPYIVLPL